MKKGKEVYTGIRIEKLSSDNHDLFMIFFKNNNTEASRRNFHPFEFSEEALEKEFSSINKDLFFGVFSVNNKMIGFGMLRGWDEGYEIPSLGVLVAEKMRGSGIGGQLVKFLVDAAKGNGSKNVRLSVYEDNEVAMSIYLGCGFKTIEKKNISGRIRCVMSRKVT